MKTSIRKKACILFAAVILLGNGASVGSTGQAEAASLKPGSIINGLTVSDWAKAEIEKAANYGLIPQRLLTADGRQPATREELCELSVLLCEKLSGQTASLPSVNPFTDTSNTEILKAYILGITSGTSVTTFSPNDVTNREQVATMFGRALLVLYPNNDYSTAGAPDFSDQADISSWALQHVLYMSKIGILKGSNGNFMPKPTTDAQKQSGYGMTKREEAIAITVRIYEKYKSTKASLTPLKTNLQLKSPRQLFSESLLSAAAPATNERDKLNNLDFASPVFRPVYSPKVTLLAACRYNSDGSRVYSSANNTVVRSDGAGVEPFKITLAPNAAKGAVKIIWQVSLAPFSGGPVTAMSPAPGGLLLSGSVSPQTTAFDIDFNKVKTAENTLLKKNATVTSGGLSISSAAVSGALSTAGASRYTAPVTYYVRAYLVGALGNSMGDAGSGMAVLYGDPIPAESGALSSLTGGAASFALKPAKAAGSVQYGTEFPNTFIDATERELSAPVYKNYSVLPAGFPAKTQELKIQVTQANPTGMSWRNSSGVVYEKSYFPDDAVFKDLSSITPLGIAIDFSTFAPASADMKDGQNIPYYIRAIAFTAGDVPGTVKASYSGAVLIKYTRPDYSKMIIYENKMIDPPSLPQIAQVTYTPVKWETEGWQYHYIVTRQPSVQEVFGSISSDTSPFTPYYVGAKLDFTPQPEDKSWWEAAWDAITGFFADLVSFITDLVNWVSEAYSGLKSGLISFAASALPLGEPFDSALKGALAGIVDYGLVSIGIPPTLPNFDELSEMGTDYLATMAMEQAGVPASGLVSKGVSTLAGGIGQSMQQSNTGAPNPLNWNFIKLDPDWLYTPAHLAVELYNPYGVPTPAGSLYFSVDRKLDLSKNGTDGAVTRLYAVYGSSLVEVFKPVYSVRIPALAPGQRLTVPVYLEEPTYNNGTPVDKSDFRLLYCTYDTCDFGMSITYDLPSAAEVAKSRGLPEVDTSSGYTRRYTYTFNRTGDSVSYQGAPETGWTK
jgi:hypothetical protein